MPAMQSAIAEREAELAALQSAFDEYITSSRELEEELDAELAKMQDKLADSSAANTALSSQLENIAPQLASLEKALGDAKRKLDTEAQLRREAELAQDEAEARCREAEGSLLALREECDAAHEELAFSVSELEETRLELEVERARHKVELDEIKSDLEIQKEKSEFPPERDFDQENEYVKRLEDELELVTEQLIETEQRLSQAEEKLAEERAAAPAVNGDRALALEHNEEKKQQSEMDETVRALQEENEALKEREQQLKQQLAISKEELTLTMEELQAAEEDAKRLDAELKEAQSSSRQEAAEFAKQLEREKQEARTAAAGAETLEMTLQAATTENVSLKDEVQNLNVALENAKADHASVLMELEAVDERFDQVREEAQQEGREAASKEIRAELEKTHQEQVEELESKIQALTDDYSTIQHKLDESETALATARDAQSGEKAAQSELVTKLQSQLARVKEQVVKKDKEIKALKSTLESRVTKAEEDVVRLEKELSTTKGKLAEAEAHLIVHKRDKERAAATIPTKKKSKKVLSESSSDDESSRDSLAPLSSFGQSHALSRRVRASRSRRRSRSSSPTTPQRLEYRIAVESAKAKELQEKYDSLKDQNRMGEIRIKRLEEDLKCLQTQAFSENRGAPVMTHLSHLSTLAEQQDTDVREDGAANIQDVLDSRDPKRIAQELKELDKRYSSQREHNAQLLSKVLSLQGNIQVCCRVRPMSMTEIERGQKNVVEALSETEVGCLDSRTKKWKSFAFDKVWSPDQTQSSVFGDVEPLALSVVDGYNACIFAYGQTGSGKTYTMEGIDKAGLHGISYRTIQKIFNLLNLRAKQQKVASRVLPLAKSNDEGEEETREDGETDGVPSFNFNLEVGMLEIYNDEVYDLLTDLPAGASAADKKAHAKKSNGKATLEIRRNADGLIEVPYLTKEKVRSIEDVMALLKRGNSNRATAATDLNEHSSRSHMVLTVDVSSGLSGQQENKGKLYLVDLAGSERVRKSNVEGDQLKEAGFINKSLSALGNVMEALDRKASHVPYRDSKLTYLLQDSLGGNSRTMMVVTVCPMDTAFDESVHALQFATRVRRIQLGAAQRNVTSRNLEETVKSLTAEMKMLTKAKEKSESQLNSLKRDNSRIQDRLQTISQSRAKAQQENRTLDVLRKNNSEMANRWQKEKNMREQMNVELEKSQTELKRIHQQLVKASRKSESLALKLQEKEQQLDRSSRELRKAKEAASASNIRARTAQIIGSRGTRTPVPSKSSDRVEAARDESFSSDQTPPNQEMDVSEIREKVLVLLEKHDETKVGRIDIIMEKFKGKEGLLLEKMVQRYEGDGAAQAKLKKRSEMALARHKERMRARMAEKQQ